MHRLIVWALVDALQNKNIVVIMGHFYGLKDEFAVFFKSVLNNAIVMLFIDGFERRSFKIVPNLYRITVFEGVFYFWPHPRLSTLLVFTWPEIRGTNNWWSLSYPLAGVSQFARGVQAVGAVVLHQVDQRAEVVAGLHDKFTLISLVDPKVLHPTAWPHCREIHTYTQSHFFLPKIVL